jgi:hypothetical protein
MKTQTTFKYELQHTGKPYAGPIPAHAWNKLSTHYTIKAALKRIDSETAHWEPWTWCDHFKIIRSSDDAILDDQYADYLINNGWTEDEINKYDDVWHKT